MRRVKGFIYLVDCGSGEMMFGKKVETAASDLELSCNFLTSGLTPFVTAMEARVAKYEFVDKRMHGDDEYNDTSIARIEMLIAENDEELDVFRKKRSLAVACYQENGDVRLRGRWVEGCARAAIPGADLIENGFEVFRRFKDAYHTASELHRQSDRLLTTIATFKLTRL